MPLFQDPKGLRSRWTEESDSPCLVASTSQLGVTQLKRWKTEIEVLTYSIYFGICPPSSSDVDHGK